MQKYSEFTFSGKHQSLAHKVLISIFHALKKPKNKLKNSPIMIN
jgi:hypothetical protein